MGSVAIGMDVGQKHDPTAICVAEMDMRVTGRILHRHATGQTQCSAECKPEMAAHFTARFLQRLPLGTSYPNVAERLVAIVGGLRARGIDRMELRIDSTGVGAPVVDIMRNALRSEPCQIVAVTFTHGDRYVRDGALATLGKAFLVSRLQALLQTTRIELPNTAEAKALAEELQVYEIRIDQDANDKYGAFKVGAHDDLVTALGLSVISESRQNSAVGMFAAAKRD
jgi:hypothetical protein